MTLDATMFGQGFKSVELMCRYLLNHETPPKKILVGSGFGKLQPVTKENIDDFFKHKKDLFLNNGLKPYW